MAHALRIRQVVREIEHYGFRVETVRVDADVWRAVRRQFAAGQPGATTANIGPVLVVHDSTLDEKRG